MFRRGEILQFNSKLVPPMIHIAHFQFLSIVPEAAREGHVDVEAANFDFGFESARIIIIM